ncbi:MAG: DMT family transporter [Hydrogenibacillus sp.]|nr:DMT family transporter [Hydrogenibacillus sp.]
MLLGVVFISTSAIWVRLSGSPPAVTAAYRLLFTVMLMLPYAFLRRKSLISQWKTLSPLDVRWLAVSGVLLAVHFDLWFWSLDYTSVASSVVLVTLQPLFTFAGGMIFFRERLNVRMWLGGASAILGSVLIGWGDFAFGGMALFGDALALLAALFVSLYWMIGQRVRVRLDATAYTFALYTVATVVLFALALARGERLYAYVPHDWLYFVALAVFPTLLGHSLFNWVIRWIPASTLSVAILGEAVGSALLAYMLFGETLHLGQWVGGTMILIGIALAIRHPPQIASR